MIKPLRLSAVADFISAQTPWRPVTAQTYQGDAEFTRVSTDSRTVNAGDLFVALRGERFDAHDFIQDAVAKQPCALVVERAFTDIALPQLVVNDSLLALGQIASLNRQAFTGPLVAITGSSGKTTVKTLLANILQECGPTFATPGNFNNHIGVPLTLLQLEAHHEYAVIEMGASGPQEIAYLCSLAQPQVAMINNVMPAHIQGFGSIEGVARAKGEIYQALPAQGTAVVNMDDAFAADWLNDLNEQRVIRVSLNTPHADCFAQQIHVDDDCLVFSIHLQGEEIPVRLRAQGEHNIRNALMAAACASTVGANAEHIARGLANFAPVAGRMSRHRGINGVSLIDDSYNANPGSVRAAIDVLATIPNSILVLGDLGELGENAPQMHAELGEYARAKKLSQLLTVGKFSQHAAHSFGEGAHHFTDKATLVAHLRNLANHETTFLIKGSRSAGMDSVVRDLCVPAGDSH